VHDNSSGYWSYPGTGIRLLEHQLTHCVIVIRATTELSPQKRHRLILQTPVITGCLVLRHLRQTLPPKDLDPLQENGEKQTLYPVGRQPTKVLSVNGLSSENVEDHISQDTHELLGENIVLSVREILEKLIQEPLNGDDRHVFFQG
jgi:hypothetical protein